MIRNSRTLVLLFYCLLLGTLGVTTTVTAGSVPEIAGMAILRIGTGGIKGNYFPVGSLIATAISDPVKSTRANPSAALLSGADTTALNLLAVTQTSNGSVANIEDISNGLLEIGFAQADIAYWAYHGRGLYAGRNYHPNLRAIATLYPEAVHLIVAKHLAVNSVSELNGMRVAVDEPGSGTLISVEIILNAFGLDSTAIKPVYVKPHLAIELIQQQKLDAFFTIAGFPVKAVQQLIATDQVRLLPISGPIVDKLLQQYPFFSRIQIPNTTYQTDQPIATVAVGAQLVVDKSTDEEIVYQLTKRIWHPATQQYFKTRHPVSKQINLTSAFDNLTIPLHVGAARFYLEKGLATPSLPDLQASTR